MVPARMAVLLRGCDDESVVVEVSSSSDESARGLNIEGTGHGAIVVKERVGMVRRDCPTLHKREVGTKKTLDWMTY